MDGAHLAASRAGARFEATGVSETDVRTRGQTPVWSAAAEALARGWTNFVGRLDGPMHLRFVVQPAVAVLLAIRAGVRDARKGAPPLLADLRNPAHRRERMRDAWRDVRRVFLVAVALDAAYQVWVHRGIYALELLVTATVLAVVPYGLVRGPAARIARAHLAARERARRAP
jgi:hypothetical protein